MMNNCFGRVIYTDDFMWNEMGIRELPKYLYHYTSIDTLALILKNKTFRFNRLDAVNDMNEAISKNLPRASTAVFASCWTSQSEESIPLWNMYTKNMDGVRIKLPINMFLGRYDPLVYEKGGARIYYPEVIQIERENLEYGLNTHSIIGPNKICYTNDEKMLYSNVLTQCRDNIFVNLYDLGMFKSKHWEFEQEWRFRILGFIEEFSLPNDDCTKRILDLEKYPVKNKYIDVLLDPGVFDEMEILLGPKATESQYIIVNSLLEKYAPKAILLRSRLQIR